MGPPPPPMPQLTPQIPLTGFVARVQENSKSDGQRFSPQHVEVFAACCMLPSSPSHPSVCTVIHIVHPQVKECARIAIVQSVRFQQYATVKNTFTEVCILLYGT